MNIYNRQYNISYSIKISLKDKILSYNEGIHSEPTTTIAADSKLWLDISNGDVAVLLKLNDLFTASESGKKTRKQKKEAIDAKFVYKTFEPNRIKRIFVVNASPRTEKYSKSLMMANKFIAGAKSAGAEVEMVSLKDKTIEYCTFT